MCVGMNGDSSEKQESHTETQSLLLKEKKQPLFSHNNALRDKLKINKASSNFQNKYFHIL